MRSTARSMMSESTLVTRSTLSTLRLDLMKPEKNEARE